MDVDGSCQLSADSQPKSSDDVIDFYQRSVHSIQRRRRHHGQVCSQVLQAAINWHVSVSQSRSINTSGSAIAEKAPCVWVKFQVRRLSSTLTRIPTQSQMWTRISIHTSRPSFGIFHAFPAVCRDCLQCFDAVGWAAGRASGSMATESPMVREVHYKFADMDLLWHRHTRDAAADTVL